MAEVVGYQLLKGNFRNITPNLPQRIVVLGEANNAKQGSFALTPNEFQTAKSVGETYGFGSPLYQMARILRPLQGDGVGGIPTVVIPQEEAASATYEEQNITITGTASANARHTVVLSGRRGIDGKRFDFTVNTGDTNVEISQKIVDTINGILESPVDATQDVTETADESALLTTKWKGVTANDLDVTIDTNGQPVGITYSVAQVTAGSGVPGISTALSYFNEDWNTIVINPYGDPVFSSLETFNGKPDPDNPSGRYSETVFKPFVALFGHTIRDKNNLYDFSTHKDEVTNVACPAPGAKNFGYEVAAAYAQILGVQAQNAPHRDISGYMVPDINPIDNAGDFANYDQRDAIVKSGHSTAVQEAGQFKVKDFVTSYHPDGEDPWQFSWVRNLMIDWNVYFGYFLRERQHVVDHVLASNADVVDAEQVIKPKDWKRILEQYAENLSRRGLIADPGFMVESLDVNISSTNPDRLETRFRYKRTGFGRIASTVAEAGFNFGS